MLQVPAPIPPAIEKSDGATNLQPNNNDVSMEWALDVVQMLQNYGLRLRKITLDDDGLNITFVTAEGQYCSDFYICHGEHGSGKYARLLFGLQPYPNIRTREELRKILGNIFERLTP